jgi:hypothetical protein
MVADLTVTRRAFYEISKVSYLVDVVTGNNYGAGMQQKLF